MCLRNWRFSWIPLYHLARVENINKQTKQNRKALGYHSAADLVGIISSIVMREVVSLQQQDSSYLDLFYKKIYFFF